MCYKLESLCTCCKGFILYGLERSHFVFVIRRSHFVCVIRQRNFVCVIREYICYNAVLFCMWYEESLYMCYKVVLFGVCYKGVHLL